MYNSEFCEVSYNEQLNVAFVKWKKFCCKDDYRKPALYAIDIMQVHDGCNFVCDTRNGFEDEEDDAQWILDEFIPRAASTTCKMFFFIISKDNVLKEELERHSTGLRKMFKVFYCFDLTEVENILEQNK